MLLSIHSILWHFDGWMKKKGRSRKGFLLLLSYSFVHSWLLPVSLNNRPHICSPSQACVLLLIGNRRGPPAPHSFFFPLHYCASCPTSLYFVFFNPIHSSINYDYVAQWPPCSLFSISTWFLWCQRKKNGSATVCEESKFLSRFCQQLFFFSIFMYN